MDGFGHWLAGVRHGRSVAGVTRKTPVQRLQRAGGIRLSATSRLRHLVIKVDSEVLRGWCGLGRDVLRGREAVTILHVPHHPAERRSEP
jgi:hypothetical protein